jgi:hypothetical protein
LATTRSPQRQQGIFSRKVQIDAERGAVPLASARIGEIESRAVTLGVLGAGLSSQVRSAPGRYWCNLRGWAAAAWEVGLGVLAGAKKPAFDRELLVDEPGLDNALAVIARLGN